MQTLTVVNKMLATMGERPLPTLTTPHRFLNSAKAALAAELTTQLARGWWFNTEINVLTPQADTGQIVLGGDIINFKPARCQSQYVKRGGKVYDASKGTYYIGGSVRASVIRTLSFEDIPDSAAAYFAACAVKNFQQDFDGDTAKGRQLDDEVQKTRIAAEADQTRYVQANLIEDNPRLQEIKRHMRRRAR